MSLGFYWVVLWKMVIIGFVDGSYYYFKREFVLNVNYGNLYGYILVNLFL